MLGAHVRVAATEAVRASVWPDDNSYENVWKNGGKATMTAKVVVSNQNKTLTITQTPIGAQGAAASSVAAYDRQ